MFRAPLKHRPFLTLATDPLTAKGKTRPIAPRDTIGSVGGEVRMGMVANDDGSKLSVLGQSDEGDRLLPAGEIKTPADVRHLHLKMIDVQRDRVNRALKAERLQGPALDRSTSTEMRRLNSMIAAYHQFYEPERVESPRGTNVLAGMLAAVFEKQPRRPISSVNVNRT